MENRTENQDRSFKKNERREREDATLGYGPRVVRASSFSREDKSRLLHEIFQLLRP